MASGNTLGSFFPSQNEQTATNYALQARKNLRPCLNFDTATGWAAVFSAIMPRNYAGGGLTVYIHSIHDQAGTGTIGWLVSFERCSDATTDLDGGDSFAAAQTVTAATVPATAGVDLVQSVAFTNGAQMDSIAAGDLYRIKIVRDVANDTATNYSSILGVEIKET